MLDATAPNAQCMLQSWILSVVIKCLHYWITPETKQMNVHRCWISWVKKVCHKIGGHEASVRRQVNGESAAYVQQCHSNENEFRPNSWSLRTMSSSDRRKSLRADFLSDATAKNSSEHTR